MPDVFLLWAQRRESTHDLKRLRSGAVAAAVLLVLILPLAALGQVSTASLSVQVVDEGEEHLPGVTVNVINTETGLQRTGITDENGTVQLQAVPPGTYEIAGQLEGMITPASEVFQLMVGQRAQLTVTLRPQITDAITVTGDPPLVDVFRMDSSTNVIREQIEELPVLDRKFEQLALITPGTQRDRAQYFNRTGAPVLATGSTSAQVAYLVDGVDFSDPFQGMSRVRFGQDSIQEFRVLSRFDAQTGRSTGGALSVVTKSGTNKLRGSAFGFYRADAMRARGALEQDDADFSRFLLGFGVGGPMLKDRSHFFVSSEYFNENDTALFRPGGAFLGLGADVPHPIDQITALLSLSHRFNSSSIGNLKLNFERKREDNYQVGGVNSQENGWSFNRDGWNALYNQSWVLSQDRLNDLRLQAGHRRGQYFVNSTAMTEWFSFGSTLQTGSDWLGEGCEDDGYLYEVRDTFHWSVGSAGDHQLRAGGSLEFIDWTYREDRFLSGMMVYLTDTRAFPAMYRYGEGSSFVSYDTTLVGLFAQDDWRIRDNLTLSLGLRYDIDTEGNNPDIQYDLLPNGRDVDTDNYQLRGGFSWDIARDGRNVLRGGVGSFIGRYVVYSALNELQFNGTFGRSTRRNLNGALFGLPPEFWLDPTNPEQTGVILPPDATGLADRFENPESTQASLGFSHRIGQTQLILDAEALYAEGRKETLWRDTNFGGNSNPVRLNPNYFEIDTYTNEGRSRYQSLAVGLNGTIPGGHLLAASLTIANKKNLSDDPLVLLPPSDPSDPEAEWGRSLTDERYRLVVSGVFRVPWNVTISPLYEYGSGQPWNRTYGYDYNGDFWATDRPEGVLRNDQDGPPFRQLNLRIAKALTFRGSETLELILEVYNLFNTTNFDVNSVDGAIYLQGPTLLDPSIPYVSNPRFGVYTATHSPREVQLGVRYRF